METNPEKKEIELLKESLYFINQIPRRHIFGGKYKDSYALASAISEYLKQLENAQTERKMG